MRTTRRHARDRDDFADVSRHAAEGLDQHRAEATDLARPMREYAQLIPEPSAGGLLRFDDFPFQEAWYGEEVANAEEVVWRKSSQVGMCLVPETRVLTADLRWVELGNIEEGDVLLAASESPDGGGQRKMVRGRVTARWETRKSALRLTLADGRTLVGSADHRLLAQHDTRRPGLRSDERACASCEVTFGSVRALSMHRVRVHGAVSGHNRLAEIRWSEIGDLRAGDRLRVVADVWGEPGYEDGWLAGVIDGEGHLASSGAAHALRRRASGAELVISQQLNAVYRRAAGYLAAGGYRFNEQRSARPNGRPDVGRLSICCTRDLLRLLGATRPSKYVAESWWEGLRLAGGGRGNGRECWVPIVAIEPLGELSMVDIETTAGSFLAEGVVSHNSAYAWRWAVRRSDQFGETGVYIFPTDTHVRDFGDERIEPAIEESPYLKSRIRPRFVRHKTLKRIGRGFLHLRGSNSRAGAQSIAAQFLVFDEYDHLDPLNLPQIERRLSGARAIGKRPRVRRLGNPTIDNYGISAAYEASDRRVWLVACPECGFEQEISFWENLRWQNAPDGPVMRAGHDEYADPNWVERAWRACRECDAELDVRAGGWVAQNPDASVIGFYAHRLIVPRTDLVAIVKASRKTKPQEVEAFHNNDLGVPYSPGEGGLDMAALLAACQLGGPKVEAYVGPNPTTMGVDVAGERDLSVQIDEQLPPERQGVPNPRRSLWVGEVKQFQDLVPLMHAFRVQVCAIDSNPERRFAKLLRSQFPGRVVLVEYDDRNEAESLKVETGEAGTPLEGVPLKVRVNRTEALDAMIEAVRQLRSIPLQEPPPKWFEQMRSPRRRTEISASGKPKRVYVTTGTHGDDYAHAATYALVATELWRARGEAHAMREEHVLPDEDLGFRRVRLADDTAADDYRPGFE